MFEEHLSKLTVAQLKEELTNRTLETTGKKAELVTRLNTYLEGWHKDIKKNKSLKVYYENIC